MHYDNEHHKRQTKKMVFIYRKTIVGPDIVLIVSSRRYIFTAKNSVQALK